VLSEQHTKQNTSLSGNDRSAVKLLVTSHLEKLLQRNNTTAADIEVGQEDKSVAQHHETVRRLVATLDLSFITPSLVQNG